VLSEMGPPRALVPGQWLRIPYVLSEMGPPRVLVPGQVHAMPSADGERIDVLEAQRVPDDGPHLVPLHGLQVSRACKCACAVP
jgi:hypothetical protein